MRSHEFVKEIEDIGKGFNVGKDYIDRNVLDDSLGKLMPLPGGSGLMYGIGGDRSSPVVSIVDPNAEVDIPPPKKQPWESKKEYAYRVERHNKRLAQYKAKMGNNGRVVGRLSLDNADFPIKNALEVDTIVVDPQYRGLNIAKSLYGIVLTIMKRPLVAGHAQSQGGQRNWLSLASVPGVETKGYIKLDPSQLNTRNVKPGSPQYNARDKRIDNLMHLGGQYLGTTSGGWSGSEEFWAFDVVPDGNRLGAALNTDLSKVYARSPKYETGLYAVWTGRA